MSEGRESYTGRSFAPAGTVLCLPYPLSTNHLYTTGNDGIRRRSKDATEYHRAAGWIAKKHFRVPLMGRIRVDMHYWPKRGVGLDIDNVTKCALDSLKGICWNDDSQIWQLSITRHEPMTGGAFQVTIQPVAETL